MRITPTQLKAAEFLRTTYVVKTDISITQEDILRPEFWAHVVHILKPHDIIQVITESGEWEVELFVQAVGTGYAKVSVRNEYNYVAKESKSFTGYGVRWAGRSDKFRIERSSDKVVLQKGFATKDDAEKWLEQHVKAMAA